MLALLLVPCTAFSASRIMVVSDTHFLAPELYKGSELFLQAMAAGDGKLVQASDILLPALIAQAKAEAPDALVITGDLTFNGERASHEMLSKALRSLIQDGIPVWVLPGNHDINVRSARVFDHYAYFPTDTVTSDAFCEIYHDMLGTLDGTQPGICYTADISDTVSLLMLDCACYEPDAQVFGLADPSRLAWAEETLASCQESGRTVISCTHHSVVPHTSLWQENFVIWNHQTLLDTLCRYGVPVNLSGHLHIQHIAKQGLYDIASGAFAIFPHRYGILTIEEDEMHYESHTLDETFLPEGFMDMSREWFRTTSISKTRSSLDALQIPENQVRAMLDYAADLNLAYFTGSLTEGGRTWMDHEAYDMWTAFRDTLPFAQYLDLILKEASRNALAIP